MNTERKTLLLSKPYSMQQNETLYVELYLLERDYKNQFVVWLYDLEKESYTNGDYFNQDAQGLKMAVQHFEKRGRIQS